MKKQNKWLDNFGKADNANESNVSLSENFNGLAYDTSYRDYSPAWGGQFQDGGYVPIAQTGITQQDVTRVDNNAADRIWGIQRELDAEKLSRDAFKEKYEIPLHQFKMRDSNYASAFQRQLEQRRQQDPNYAEVNLPSTDIRSSVYQGNPNLAFLPGTSEGQSRAALEDAFLATTTLSAPLLPVNTAKIGQLSKIVGNYLTTQTPLRNTYNLLPEGTFKGYSKLKNPSKSYRVAGMDAFDDFVESGVLRSKRPELENNQNLSLFERMQLRPTTFPSFQKGYADLAYLPEQGGVVFETSLPTFKRGQINPVTGVTIGGRHYAHRVIDPETGATLTNVPGKNISVYTGQPNWLKGHKQIDIPKKEQGGSIPGTVGFTYARTGSTPSEGKYAKKTLPSALNGKEMKFYQEGLDWKPKSMQYGGTEQISYNDPRYAELYKNRQVGSWSPQHQAFNLPDLDEVTVTATRPSLYEDLRGLTRTVGETAAEFTGIPGTIRFSKDPVENIKGLINTAGQTGLGLTRFLPIVASIPGADEIGFDYNAQDVEGAFNTLDALGIASGVAGLARRPIQKGLQKVGQNLKNVRMSIPSDVAEGLQTNGIFDIFKPKPKFQSEIDWSKWNPETPKYPELINEYNAIEESTKKAGTWMKNPDGSTFQGTPEQFVQQQSSWFKKAFGESKLIGPEGSPMFLYHGSAKKFDTFDPSKFQLGDAGYSGAGIYTTPSKTTANSYATSSAKFHSGDIEPTVYQLYGQGNRPIKSSDLIKENQGRDLFNFYRDRNWKGELSPYESLREYDVAVSDQLPNVQNIRPLYDAREIVFPKNTQLKSAVGNVGFFDMTNPNIYKGLIPAGIATGLSIEQKRKGGIIKDNQGYWNPDNWGKMVEIDSNEITMKPNPYTGVGVPYDVLAFSDEGDVQYMEPGKDYKFKGSKVTEIPMAKLGINQLDAQPMKKLNQLLNFTNNPDKTNWLDNLD